jgi:predicted nuclease of predicted toxin-antitoxin system
VRFYLDEDLSPRVAAIARRHGLDVVSAHEAGNAGLTDGDQLLYVANERRCLVTENRADFARLTVQFFESQLPHAGVLLLPSSLPRDRFSAIAQALVACAGVHADYVMDYVVDYL